MGFVDEAEAGKGDLLFQKGLSLLQKHKVKGTMIIMFEYDLLFCIPVGF